MSEFSLHAQDNYILLEKAYLMLRAADDILTNECHDLYVLIRDSVEQPQYRKISGKLGVIGTGISEAQNILKTLLYVDRSSWNP